MGLFDIDPRYKPGEKKGETYTVIYGYKRSAPPRSVARPDGRPTWLGATAGLGDPAPLTTQLPKTLRIKFTRSIHSPTVISTPDRSPLYNLQAQTAHKPHLSLFSAFSNAQCSTATLGTKSGDINGVVGEVGVSLKRKGKIISSFTFTLPASLADGSIKAGEYTWKGNRHALTCENSVGREVASLKMEKPKNHNDWVFGARWTFAEWCPEKVVKREVGETFLLLGLALQEYKKRRGQGIWYTIGVGGMYGGAG